uniref:DUF7851 domain-containing protein n=1 Tax=Oryza barthii TaxID=65489 RepID=A0A0D3FSP7_9ORYZ
MLGGRAGPSPLELQQPPQRVPKPAVPVDHGAPGVSHTHAGSLGLGTKKSKAVLLCFESEGRPAIIPLGDVNKKLIRGLTGRQRDGPVQVQEGLPHHLHLHKFSEMALVVVAH